RTSSGMQNRSIVDARTNSPGSMVTLSAMRTSYDAADSPNDMPRTTARSTNGSMSGGEPSTQRRLIDCALSIIAPPPHRRAVRFRGRTRRVGNPVIAAGHADQLLRVGRRIVPQPGRKLRAIVGHSLSRPGQDMRRFVGGDLDLAA